MHIWRPKLQAPKNISFRKRALYVICGVIVFCARICVFVVLFQLQDSRGCNMHARRLYLQGNAFKSLKAVCDVAEILLVSIQLT